MLLKEENLQWELERGNDNINFKNTLVQDVLHIKKMVITLTYIDIHHINLSPFKVSNYDNYSFYFSL